MAFKLIVALAFIGIASAYVAPLTLISANQHLAPLSLVQVQQQNPLPQYTYSYGVHDSISGDSKTQTETRNGDNVKGEYSFNEADGYKRTVTYTADSENGFQAVVDRKPIADVAADIQASIAAQSVVPAPAPLVIKSLTPLNSTALPIVPSAEPLVYYSQGLVNSAPLDYTAPLVVHSAPISAPLAFNAAPPLIVNSAPIAAPLAYNSASLIVNSPPIGAPLAYNPAPLIVNSAPIAYPGSGTYLDRSVFKPIANVTYSENPVLPITYGAPYLISN